MITKTLVIGGAGFIGSNLCKRLADNGDDVTSIDNYFTGKKENHIDGVKYIKLDSRDIDKLTEVPEVVYHMGEYSRVMTSFEDIAEVVEYNGVGTLRVLEYCRKNNVRLIYAGSSTKFGADPRLLVVYIDEDVSIDKIREIINKTDLNNPLEINFTYKHKNLGEKNYKVPCFVILLHN